MSSQTSRFSRNQEKQTKRQIVTSLVGIVIVLVVMVQLGPFFIGEAGNIISSLQGKSSDDSAIKSADYLEPPTLKTLPKATKNQEINVSGSTQYTDGTIELYINDASHKEIEIDNNGMFSQESIRLNEGSNSIRARVKIGDKTSDFSHEYLIFFTKNEPKLEISFPQEGAMFTKADREINVSGKTDLDNTVTVNGFRAIVDGEGNFSYYLRLNEGENLLKIETENTAGKKVAKELKVTYKLE